MRKILTERHHTCVIKALYIHVCINNLRKILTERHHTCDIKGKTNSAQNNMHQLTIFWTFWLSSCPHKIAFYWTNYLISYKNNTTK